MFRIVSSVGKMKFNIFKTKQKMEKQKALDRLSAIENEAKELRKIIENADKPKNIMERVKTFSEACEVLGINPNQITNNTFDSKDEIAYKKLKIITKALNEGWEPDWKNQNQYKYFPWFDMNKKPGSGFDRSSYCIFWSRSSSVSSRLGFKTNELALYAAKQFEQEYYDYLTI